MQVRIVCLDVRPNHSITHALLPATERDGVCPDRECKAIYVCVAFDGAFLDGAYFRVAEPKRRPAPVPHQRAPKPVHEARGLGCRGCRRRQQVATFEPAIFVDSNRNVELSRCKRARECFQNGSVCGAKRAGDLAFFSGGLQDGCVECSCRGPARINASHFK